MKYGIIESNGVKTIIITPDHLSIRVDGETPTPVEPDDPDVQAHLQKIAETQGVDVE